MSSEIKLVRSEFDAALEIIQKADTRSGNNNSNFKDDILKTTTATSVTAYEEAISTLKRLLLSYSNCLQKDLGKLSEAATIIEEADRACAK